MENNELRNYFEKFGEFPYLPIMATYEDDIFQYLLTMAISRNKPLTEEEIDKEYNNKIDVVKEEKEGEKDMEENEARKIRTMLKRYGAVDEEIENFMEDLANYKEDVQEEAQDEEEEFSPYTSEIVAKLKETDEGREILMNAPKMEKEQFIKAVKEYLAK